MSLILDALKKIEREKGAADPAVVVVGSVPWGEKSPRRWPIAAGAVAGAAIVAAGAWWLLRSPAPVPLPEPSAVTPASAIPATPARPPTAPPEPGPATPGSTTAPAAALGHAAAAAMPATTTTPGNEAAAIAPVHSGAPPPVADAASSATLALAPAATSTHAPAPAPAPASVHAPAADPASAHGVPELRLTAISMRDGHAVALVNDRLVREGDSFDGVRIVRIGDTEVEVEVRGERRVLRF